MSNWPVHPGPSPPGAFVVRRAAWQLSGAWPTTVRYVADVYYPPPYVWHTPGREPGTGMLRPPPWWRPRRRFAWGGW